MTLRRSTIGLCASAAIVLSSATSVQAAPPRDNLEPNRQGETLGEVRVLQEPYHKGVRVIGRNEILRRDSNLQLAWIDHCAYVSSTPVNFLGFATKPNSAETSGVAVVDVQDPAAPKLSMLLRDPGAMFAAETMHAIEAGGRRILVAGAYAGGKPGAKPDDAAWLEIYDASDCGHPKHLAQVKWPENVHTVTIGPSGTRVYGTAIDPFTGKGGVLILDISDPSHPRYLGKFGITRPDGRTFEAAIHEISFRQDERRIYAGVLASTDGDLNAGIGLFPPTVAGLGPDAGGIYILDNGDIVDGRPDPRLKLVGTVPHGGWHSVVPAQIGGTPYLVGAGELGACPGAWPRITNIADETRPARAGEFRLAMNRPDNCPPMTETELASGGVIGRAGTATSHYNDVDSSTQTRLGLFNFMWAGLRIADLRDPAKPEEVAYFRPGDACTGHVRYRPESGQIWFTCAASGFYVIELQPELRARLGLAAASMPAARTRSAPAKRP